MYHTYSILKNPRFLVKVVNCTRHKNSCHSVANIIPSIVTAAVQISKANQKDVKSGLLFFPHHLA